MQARAIAAQAIAEILTRGQTLSFLLPSFLEHLVNPKDQAFAQELCYGVFRWYYRLDFILQVLLTKELKPKDIDIRVLILVGLYQLGYLRTPPHAAVSATVDACDDLRKPWAKKLVNALLRKYQRDSDRLHLIIDKNNAAKYAHPTWLLEYLQRDYPDRWPAITDANNHHPPMFLRVNYRKTTRSDYMARLETAHIKAEETNFSTAGIRLSKPMNVDELPEFKSGYVSVQDLAAQLSAPLLDLKSGQRVLDACAAPGGKLTHILELEPGLSDIVAIEYDAIRYEQLRRTLDRVHLTATLVHADARESEKWWDGIPFDRILLDAPCSATGVIRRHPDIKVLRKPENIAGATQIQYELLSTLWPLLKRGGKLLYVTCSILSPENDHQIRAFSANHPDAKPMTINGEWGLTTAYGIQTLPGQFDMDGFYYACLEKT
ncbi:MAG: 16S rRNA (cytosine(967)-C(5))-methyltransferase RsmB [Gammaproteobacteria bacterium]|nr:16S rRNA (cytosine(967)-C(5))-methyltransferase RsmB [Gammaproteobacteria bacterium]